MSQNATLPASDAGSLIVRVKSLQPGPSLFWLLASLAFLPLLLAYFKWLWRYDHYQFFPFLLVGVGYLTWSRVQLPLIYPSRRITKLLFAVSMTVLLVSTVTQSPWFTALAFLLFAGSFLTSHGLFYLWIPLALLIRLPLGYDKLIISVLQGVTTRVSSFLLDLLGVPHLAFGNTIELADRELFVAEACSGVQSAFTIASVALLIAAWRCRSLVLLPLYVGVALVWAVLCNTLRVTSIAFAAYQFNIDLSQGWLHDLIGYASLLLAILLTFSTDSLLVNWFHPIGLSGSAQDNPVMVAWNWLCADRSETSYAGPSTVQISAATNSLATTHESSSQSFADGVSDSLGSSSNSHRGLTYAMSGIAMISLLTFTVNWALGTTGIVNASGEVLINPDKNLLNDLPGPVEFRYVEAMRGKADPRLGMNADRWSFTYGNLQGSFVFSQPYSEWHDLNRCYTRLEWDLLSCDPVQPSVDVDDRTPVAVSHLSRRDGAHGYLLFSGVQADGVVLDPPQFALLHRALKRCTEILSGRRYGGVFTGDCTMMQLWVVSGETLDDRTIGVLVDAVGHARQRIVKELFAASKQ